MPLTELTIKNLKPKVKLYRVADGNGLCLEITPSGSKLWRWRFYHLGKAQMAALGKYPDIPLAQARKLRDEARAILQSGRHPTLDKKAKKLRNAMQGANTFEKIARLWMETKSKGLTPKYAKQNLERLQHHVFPVIGPFPITEITIPDVVRVVERIGNRGTIETAKRMKQLMGQVFRYAAQRGLCDHNPAADLRDILPSHKEKHYSCVPMAEVPDLLRAIEAKETDLGKYALLFLALTFVRTGELIGARWDEIDFDRAEWHIPKERMKMKRPHVVPLSHQAIAILKDIHALTGTKTHVFHSTASKSKHISNGIILMALRRMGYQGRMTGHGFRTLASTLLNEKGYAPDVIERQLAHEDNDKIRSAYNRAEYLLERKKMMQDYADLLEGMRVNKDNPDKIIQMRKFK